MSEHRIPLSAKQLTRLTALRQHAEAAQSAYGAALGVLVDGADIAGEPTGLRVEGDALVITVAE